VGARLDAALGDAPLETSAKRASSVLIG